MEFLKNLSKITLQVVLVLGIASCSSKPEVKEFSESADASQEITNLRVALDNSKAMETDLLAPVSFREAEKSLDEAREMESDKKSEKKILKEVALGQAYLEQARKRSDDARDKLEDVLVARDAAIEAKADILLPKSFENLDAKVKEETTKIEEEKDNDLKEKRSSFITGYLDLELAAIKQTHLGESKVLIDESVKNGADHLTPETLASANNKYKEVDLYITKNRHNTSEISDRSDKVLERATELAALTATARGLAASTPEERALKMQAEEARLDKTQEALMEEQTTSKTLAASNEKLSEAQKLNATYEEARKNFSSDEAEVYKQGNKLVIRLRTFEFPKGKAVITGDNYALLKKVEDVIESFDKSKVVVEGHTDSTGGQQLNQRLSAKRAEAVKTYLEVNTSAKSIDFESVGYGFDKPLASNKTPEGRAQNRRVDVIIEPTQL